MCVINDKTFLGTAVLMDYIKLRISMNGLIQSILSQTFLIFFLSLLTFLLAIDFGTLLLSILYVLITWNQRQYDKSVMSLKASSQRFSLVIFLSLPAIFQWVKNMRQKNPHSNIYKSMLLNISPPAWKFPFGIYLVY